METTEQILERQCAALNFENGKVKYFSISTQWEEADTIGDAIKNILEADKKYDGKTPLAHWIEEKGCIKAENLEPIVFPDDIEKLMEEARKVIMTPFYLP
jgi:hypothetical protein